MVGYGKDLYEWYGWWANDRHAISAQGHVLDIHSLHGRDKGKQYVWLKIGNKKKRFDAVFSTEEIQLLSQLDEPVKIKFYPTATGSRYIFSVSGLVSKKNFYEGQFHDELWPGLIMSFIVLFLFVILIFSLVFLFGYIKPKFNKYNSKG